MISLVHPTRKDLEVKVEELQLRVHEKTAQILVLTSENEHLRSGQDVSGFQLTAVRFSQASEREKMLLKENTVLNRNIDALDAKNSALEAKHTTLTANVIDLKAANTALEDKVKNLEERMAAMAVTNTNNNQITAGVNNIVYNSTYAPASAPAAVLSTPATCTESKGRIKTRTTAASAHKKARGKASTTSTFHPPLAIRR